MEKINVAELLKDCPKGIELDCILFDDVYFDCIDDVSGIIKCYVQDLKHSISISFNKYGGYSNISKSKCAIFPKGKTTWEGFVPPCKFKDGDIISDSLGTCIFKGEGEFEGTVNYYCGISNDYFRVKDDKRNPSGHYGCIVGYRLSTEEEKQKLFDAIKANGYKWNAETKTLEELIETEDLQPYKEENMKEELEQITLDIPKGYEFFGINDDNQVVLAKKQLQYPTTYEECCEVIGYKSDRQSVTGYLADLIENFQQLIICRDAYWKIAGEQMGLGKTWKPSANDEGKTYSLYYNRYTDSIDKFSGIFESNAILDFPTKEMRDAFYENFKKLINETKELL